MTDLPPLKFLGVIVDQLHHPLSDVRVDAADELVLFWQKYGKQLLDLMRPLEPDIEAIWDANAHELYED